MSKDRNEIVKFCCDYLECDKFDDYCLNGLQVEGTDRITKIVTGVSWSLQLAQHAIDVGAEMLLVHHGLFRNMLKGEKSQLLITGYVKKRLKQLLTHDINLVGFHLPLDAHPKIGNNALICDMLNINMIEPFEIGFIGNLAQEITIDDFIKNVDIKLSTNSVVVNSGPRNVKRVAVVSGGSSEYFEKAFQCGADTFVCGESRESVVRAAEELGINVINAGHYNTEKAGIENLGRLVAEKFGIDVEFFDVPCEI